MRTILSPALAATFAVILSAQAQPIAQIEQLEKRVSEVPDDVPARANLLRLYFGKPVGFSAEQIRDARRRHIHWLIEHRPDAPELSEPRGTADSADNEAADLWSKQVVNPSAAAKTLSNAMAFAAALEDLSKLRVLIDAAWSTHPENFDVASGRGVDDVLLMAGASRRDADRRIILGSPPVPAARREIESSNDAALLGAAGRQLSQITGILMAQATLGNEDPIELARKWLIRAHQIDSKRPAWTEALIQNYQLEANMTLDPHGKVQILRKALEIADTDSLQISLLPDLMNAEVEGGDDDSASRDANKLFPLLDRNPKRGNREDLMHQAHTALGRIALDRNDVAEAKLQLLASANNNGSPVLSSFGPRMTLAQELLDRGERDVVLEYLEACRSFWKYDQGKLDHYTRLIRKGSTRDVFAFWNHPGGMLAGHPAPPFKLHDLSNKDWTLKEIAGKSAALVFWDTNCKSCAGQISETVNEASKLRVLVLAVNVGDEEPAVRDYVAKNHIGIPVLLGGGDTMLRLYSADTYPSMAVIDREGRVVSYQVGRLATTVQRNALDIGAKGRIAAPSDLTVTTVSGKIRLGWHPVDGAQSYVVEWEARTEKGWPSDKDGLFRIVPTEACAAEVEAKNPIRWRVYAVNRGAAGVTSPWKLVQAGDLQ